MRRVLSILVLTILMFQIFAVGYAEIKPENGIAYVLLPKDLPGVDGVYRLNNYVDPLYAPLLTGNAIRIFDLNFGGATVVNGLAVNQDGRIYLFIGPTVSGVYTPVDKVGWLPSGQFAADSPAYIKLIGQGFDASEVSQDVNDTYLKNLQYPYKSTNYDNDFWDYGPSFTTHGDYKKETKTDACGNTYNYYFNPIKPATHKNLPLWNGPGASSAGIHNPLDPNKVILPNKWGGISWYAFGSPNAPAADVGKLADGKDGRPLITNYDFRLKDRSAICSPYSSAKYISTVVRRVYEKRDRSLDLYAYKDNVVRTGFKPYTYPYLESSNVLTATDLKITEQYAKTCADGCIPGGALNPEAIGKIESCVQVFTSTTGRRYGFNPFGKKSAPYGANDAALRVVVGGTSYNLDLNASNIKNANYFKNFLKVPLNSATVLGVSSKFETPVTPVTTSPDNLYASIATKFCIQDSWWGNGGIGYEYYAKDVTTPGMTFLKGHIYRLDYMSSTSPTPEDVGYFPGDIDAISVDGQGNLYTLTTELNCKNSPAWPDPSGLPQGPALKAEDPQVGSIIKNHPDFLSMGHWMRPSTDGTGDKEISTPSKDGDYISIFFKQHVRKVCKKYTPSAGGGFDASTVEDRGYVDAGFDAITRNIRYNNDGTFSWINNWHHEYGIGSRTASVNAEFAVVNIAARPVVENNITHEYSICRADLKKDDVPINEDTSVIFKIEGYRPYDENGNILNLIDAGKVKDVGEVYINLIPPYKNRDEDGDGKRGGFPSSMFESGSIYKPTFTWHVDLLEKNSASYSAGDVIKSWTSTPNEGGAQRRFKFKFPQPGNYAVYADVSYYYFDYSSLPIGGRPDELKSCIVHTGPHITSKVIYHVQSPSNITNDGYITNIALNNSTSICEKVDPAAGENSDGHSGCFIAEDSQPSKLSFSCQVQFIRDANNLKPGAAFSGHDGVGVWDYHRNDPLSTHVYNCNSDGSINYTKFNPGRVKYESNSSDTRYKCGTRVDTSPNVNDLKAIKWRLYIYPTYLGAPSGFVSSSGLLYGSGDFKNADVTSLGSQKYLLKVDIATPSLNVIRMPIDPQKYRVRLEIEYPRVKWIETKNDSSIGAGEYQFRSIVPDDPPLGLITTDPGFTSTAGVAKDTTPGAFVNGDSWYIGARDTTILSPTFDDPSISGANSQVATQTTGDPVSPCVIKMTCKDNNPNASFAKMQINYELPTKAYDPSAKKDGNYAPNVLKGVRGPLPTPTSYLSDSYAIASACSFPISEYGGTTGTSSKFGPGMPYQNWIGSLNFSLEGQLTDGFNAHPSSSQTAPKPHIFSKNATDPRLKTSECGLIRYDNDPPSFTVNLVSQVDNRRWKIIVSEGLKDKVANPATKEDLAKTKVEVICYKLNGSKTALANDSKSVDGSSNNPILLGNPLISLASLGLSSSVMPKVRRSSRLQITVDMDDNVNYEPFKNAQMSVIGSSKVLLATSTAKIDTSSAILTTTGVANPALKKPRGRYFVDMPMKVDSSKTYQVKINITATDYSGNVRTLIIPVKIIDSSFDARVLESKENKKL